MGKHFFFIPTLNYRSGWGTVSINYLKSLNKNEVIILCNKKNNDFDFDQFEILHPPLDYLKNPGVLALEGNEKNRERECIVALVKGKEVFCVCVYINLNIYKI